MCVCVCVCVTKQFFQRLGVCCVFIVCTKCICNSFFGAAQLELSVYCTNKQTINCTNKQTNLCVLDHASSWHLNKGWPTRWHLLYYILLNMFQTLIRPSSRANKYLLCCVGWLEACWCYVAGFSIGDVVSECSLNHQQTIPLHSISTPQVNLHDTTSTR